MSRDNSKDVGTEPSRNRLANSGTEFLASQFEFNSTVHESRCWSERSDL